MRKGYVEYVIGSFTKAGLRVTVDRQHRSPDEEAQQVRWNFETNKHVILMDRITGARYLVDPKRVVAVIVHGGDSDA